MKTTINKIKEYYYKHNMSLYISLLGSFIMGTIHLIFVIFHFDWIVVNYCIFSYLMFFSKLWQWAIEKYHIKISHFMAGIISMTIILFPMMASFILTIMYRDTPHYIFNWLIYAYALYGTIKIIFAIKNITKKDRNDKQYVLSSLALIGSLYTIQMMEFSLITTFSDNEVDNSMYLMQLFTQGAIFLFSIFIIGLFIYKLITNKKAKIRINR